MTRRLNTLIRVYDYEFACARQIVIVAGFQGVNENGDITTLGRGGSDTTALSL